MSKYNRYTETCIQHNLLNKQLIFFIPFGHHCILGCLIHLIFCELRNTLQYVKSLFLAWHTVLHTTAVNMYVDQMTYFGEICFVMILCLFVMKYSIPTVSIMIRINPTIAPITMPANALTERPSEVLLSLVSSPAMHVTHAQTNYTV